MLPSSGDSGPGDGPVGGRIDVHHTFLVPRPDYAAAALLEATPVSTQAARPSTIPVVSVR